MKCFCCRYLVCNTLALVVILILQRALLVVERTLPHSLCASHTLYYNTYLFVYQGNSIRKAENKALR